MTHNNRKDEDEPVSGTVKDGGRLVVPMFCMDTVDNDGNVVATRAQLRDASGQPLIGNKPGYAFDSRSFDDAAVRDRAADRAFEKAELSSRWKGGLQDGDFVQFGDRRMEVTGYNERGKLVLSDADAVDAKSVLQDAYADAENDLTNAWKTRTPIYGQAAGDKCTINGFEGRLRNKDGKLVCIPIGHEAKKVSSEPSIREPSAQEWALAGPLSDSTKANAYRDSVYADYEAELRDAWRR